MKSQLTLLAITDDALYHQLAIYSPIVPRTGELLNVEVGGQHFNLEVETVIYEVEKSGNKHHSQDHECVSVSLCVQPQ